MYVVTQDTLNKLPLCYFSCAAVSRTMLLVPVRWYAAFLKDEFSQDGVRGWDGCLDTTFICCHHWFSLRSPSKVVGNLTKTTLGSSLWIFLLTNIVIVPWRKFRKIPKAHRENREKLPSSVTLLSRGCFSAVHYVHVYLIIDITTNLRLYYIIFNLFFPT